jgi:hypothetical protein
VEGGSNIIESIEALWRAGDEVRGWARYWATLYRWVNARLRCNEAFARAALIIRYEDLCDSAASSIAKLLEHCVLTDESGELSRKWAPSLSRPSYYQPTFTPEEESAITEETAAVAAELGYGLSPL